MGILKCVEMPTMDESLVVQKYPLQENAIKKGSVLVVREGQSAVFCDKGRTADVFGAGTYKLDTDNLPVVTRLLSWKYGFETPYKSDIYFVATREFTGIRWGTSNPVPVSTELGLVRLRGFGAYSFRIVHPARFLTALSGDAQTYAVKSVCDALRALLVGSISTAFGVCGVSLHDMTARYAQLSEEVKRAVSDRCDEWGIVLTAFDIENLSVPPELEKAVDENARLGILRDNADVYVKLAQADAVKEAAKHGNASAAARKKFCSECGATLAADAKFCSECGHKTTF